MSCGDVGRRWLLTSLIILRFPVVLYDNEAINFDANTAPTAATLSEDSSSSADVLSGSGVLFHPLEFDAEVKGLSMQAFRSSNLVRSRPSKSWLLFLVRSIFSAHSCRTKRVRVISVVSSPPTHCPIGDASADSGRALRSFMDIARSPRMEEGVWEVKWQRRDDSVLASMVTTTIIRFSNGTH